MKRFALVLAIVAALAAVVVATASALAFVQGDPCQDQETFVCPSGTVGQAYSIQLKAYGGNGPPYTYYVRSGALPAGLSLDSNTGVISGRPTAAGSATFGLELQDKPSDPGCPGCGCVARNTCSFRDFRIDIAAGLVLSRDPLPVGTVGAAYSTTLKAVMDYGNGQTLPPSSPVTWSITAGALPSGVSLSSSDGVLSGTPTAVGAFTFTVQGALDAARTDLETYTINVANPIAIASAFSSAKPPKSEIGIPFHTAITGTGGNGALTWTLAGGTLPTGVTLGSDGSLSGTPTASGRFVFSIKAADVDGRTQTLNAVLVVAPKLGFKTEALKTARVGKLYAATLRTLGGVAPVKWKILGGKLPTGIRFQKKLGVFAGTASKEGRYRVSVEATDALGVTSKKTFVLVVKG